MNQTVLSVIGFTGAACSLLAYFKVSHGTWKAQSFRYQSLNFMSGILLIVYGWQKHALANVALNVVWASVALYGFYIVHRKLRNHRSKPTKGLSF
jgi:hypothetical protein